MGFFIFGSFILMVTYKGIHGQQIVRGPMADWRVVKWLGRWFHNT